MATFSSSWDDEPEYGLIHYDRQDLWGGFDRAHDWCARPERSKQLGSVYAVHALLKELCGVRWYLPGALGEVCPRSDMLQVRNVDIRRRPWTTYRHIGMHYWRQDYLAKGHWSIRDMFLWQVRMGLYGVEAFSCNHSLVPGWFADRVPDPSLLAAQGYEAPSQLCLSSGELLRIVCQDADDYFAGRTNYARAVGDYFPVMPHDTSQYCKCRQCQAQIKPEDTAVAGFWSDRASNYVWRFVSRVAEHVQRKHPGRWVGCCSYARYALVPDAPDLQQLPDNLFMMYCRPLPGSVRRPEYREQSRKVLREWAGKVRRWYVWEYFSHIQSQASPARFPMLFLQAIREDIRVLHSLGCRGVFNEYETYVRDCALSHLNVYMHLELLSDIDVDVNRAFDEYCSLFYGPAAVPMRQFFLLLERRGTDADHYAPAHPDAAAPGHQVVSWERVCPPDVLRQFGVLVDDACQAARGHGIYERRVAWVTDAVYGMMVRNCQRHNYGCIRASEAPVPRAVAAAPEGSFEMVCDNPGYVLWPSAIHVARDDGVFVADRGAREVLKLDRLGEVVLRIPFDCNAIAAVTTDGDGKLYVIGSNGILYKLHPDGAACSDLLDRTTNQVEGFSGASGMVLTPGGDLLVAFQHARQLRRYTSNGQLDETYGLKGTLEMPQSPTRLAYRGPDLCVLDYRAGELAVVDETTGAARHRMALEQGVALAPALYATRDTIYAATMRPHATVMVLDPELKLRRQFRVPGPFTRVVATDSTGRIYVGNDGGGLYVYSAGGTPCELPNGSNRMADGAFSEEHFALPSAVALDGEGNLLVCEFGTGRIHALDSGTLRFVGAFHVPRPYNAAIAVDAANNVYVGSSAYNCVAKLGPDRELLWLKGETGTEPGQFRQITSMALDPAGCLLVGEGGGARIQLFDRELCPVPRFAGSSMLPCTRTNDSGRASTSGCAGLALDRQGFIYAALARGPGVVKMQPDGVPVPAFVHRGKRQCHISYRATELDPPGEAFQAPGSVAVDSNGDVYVADSKLNCVKKFDRSGGYQGRFGTPGYGPGQFRGPCGLLLDGKGHLYACDRWNSRVYRLKLDTAFAAE